MTRSIQERLRRRRDLLLRWRETSVPARHAVPRSKNELLAWEMPEFGIERIGHRNACTTSHAENGALVRECLELMAELNGRRVRGRPGSEATNQRLRSQLRSLQDQLTGVVSQWHEARAAYDQEMRDRLALETRLRRAQEQLAEYRRREVTVVRLRETP